MTSAQLLQACLEWRGLEDATPCRECGGSGVKCYGSTATWRGGVGGQIMTNDVCDKCWGSGDDDRSWPSHRALTKK
jgi:DnaJ-class molecular chaperone